MKQIPNAKLNLSEICQPMLGFGGSQTFNGDMIGDFPHRSEVYRILFQELKLDFYRIRNYHDYAGQQEKFDRLTRDYAQAALKFGRGKGRGAKAPVRTMFTAWSPPARLKSNNLVSGRSDGTEKGQESATLKRDADGRYVYAEYAAWWLASVEQFKKLCGSYPDYISLQNELDLSVSYEGCRFLPTEGKTREGYELAGYDKALAAVSDLIRKTLGRSAPKIAGPEPFTIQVDGSGKGRVQSYVTPDVLARLDALAFHIYGSGAEKTDQTQFHNALKAQRAAFPKTPLMQTEFLEGDTFLKLATQIHDTLVIGEASAYFIWMASRSFHSPSWGMVYFDPNTGVIERRERFYAMKHYSAFVGESWSRVEAECADPEIRLSAFVQPKQKQAVAIFLNPTDKEKKIALTPPLGYTQSEIFRSSQGEDGERWRPLGKLPADGTLTLLKRSLVTVRFF
jgi:glucuronoarabinoxylan endo-1,4-beta-xylanase